MTPALKAIIDEAYIICGAYSIDSRLFVCRCPRCDMTDKAEQSLVQTPLRNIPAAILAAYSSSAHLCSDGRAADEMRYFLPRYLELIANDDEPDWNGLPSCLSRLPQLHWRSTWLQAEVDVLDRFFDELLSARIRRIKPIGWPLAFDIGGILELVIIAGGDVDRLLSVWQAEDDPLAAIHMAALRPEVYRDGDRLYWNSTYLRDNAQMADKIGKFLTSAEVSARIEKSFFEIEDHRLQKILSDGLEPYWPAATGISK